MLAAGTLGIGVALIEMPVAGMVEVGVEVVVMPEEEMHGVFVATAAAALFQQRHSVVQYQAQLTAGGKDTNIRTAYNTHLHV